MLSKCVVAIKEVGEARAIAKNKYETLNRASKNVLAANLGKDGTAKEKEMHPYLTKAWQEHSDALSAAELEYLSADMRWECAKITIDSIRTAISLRKQEMASI